MCKKCEDRAKERSAILAKEYPVVDKETGMVLITEVDTSLHLQENHAMVAILQTREEVTTTLEGVGAHKVVSVMHFSIEELKELLIQAMGAYEVMSGDIE